MEKLVSRSVYASPHARVVLVPLSLIGDDAVLSTIEANYPRCRIVACPDTIDNHDRAMAFIAGYLQASVMKGHA